MGLMGQHGESGEMGELGQDEELGEEPTDEVSLCSKMVFMLGYRGLHAKCCCAICGLPQDWPPELRLDLVPLNREAFHTGSSYRTLR